MGTIFVERKALDDALLSDTVGAMAEKLVGGIFHKKILGTSSLSGRGKNKGVKLNKLDPHVVNDITSKILFFLFKHMQASIPESACAIKIFYELAQFFFFF